MSIFRVLFIGIYLTIGTSLIAQLETKYAQSTDPDIPTWVSLMYQEDPDPGLVINAYEQFYKENSFVKNKHTQYYKRWLRSIAREVDIRPQTDKAYLKKSKEQSTQRSSIAWQSIGPYDWDHEAAGLSYAPGSAHVYDIEQAPSNPDILYAATATTGLWRSDDHGDNWIPLTENLLLNGATAITISPTDASVVYAEMFNSVYKSTDSGATWNPTGDAAFQAISMDTKDIIAKPGSGTEIYLASSTGFYRSTNAGATWTEILAGDYLEIEVHPTNNSIIYTTKLNGEATEFWKSTNGGISFTQQTNGWPVPASGDEQKRTEIAVSIADPSKVVALCTGSANGGSGLYGIYVSTDEGVTWTFNCCGPQPAGVPSATNMNLMGWSDEGTDDGGQYYYDLGLDISPTNADSIFVGGVQLWISADGGQTFTCPAKWSHSYKPNYVHADIHDIHYYDNSEIWISGDGGIFHSIDGGANFTRKNVGITGTDFWGFGMGHWHGDVMLGGAYHNGTLLKEENVYNNGWLCTDGGDGTLGFVNYGLDRQVYSWFNIKDLQSDRTVAPITRGFNYKPNNTYTTGRSSDLIVHPNYYTTWFSGAGTELVRTIDNGYSYDVVHDFGVDLAAMDISWSDPDVMYVTTFPGWWDTKTIHRTTDGGTTWTDITPSSAMLNGNTWIPYDIVVSEQDPMKLWIARTSMYSTSNVDGNMIYESNDGGTTWTNISGVGMNGESPSCIQLQKGTDDGLYVGTRRTAYYRSDSESDWQLYNTGLPLSTAAVRMEMYYRKSLVRNATNRSVWEIDMYENSMPVAVPSVNEYETACVGDTFYFVDHSILAENGATWQWSFDGATPASSTDREPKVVYNEPGIYDVTLTVTDVYGTDTKTIEGMVQINKSCGLDTIPGGTVSCNGSDGHIIINDFDLNAEESITVTAWIKLASFQNDYAGVFMNDGDAAGMNFREGNNTLAYHWPGGSWSWDSNLEVPVGEWAHVALVADETSITLYLNGVGSTHNTNIIPVDFTTLRLGSYKGWGSRNMDGLIDEVAFYDRALSQAEIRELRHLTKIPDDDPSLIAYYQFNDTGSTILDRLGNRDGSINGTTIRLSSTAPVGGGTSQRKTITTGGPEDFAQAHLTIGFSNAGINPNGEVVVSHLNVPPDVNPDMSPSLDKGYWIVNNYGSNQTFAPLDSISFTQTGTITNAMLDGNSYGLFKRASNADGAVWNKITLNTVVPHAGVAGTLSCTDIDQFDSFSQLFVQRDIFPRGIPMVGIRSDAALDIDPIAGASMELYLESEHQGLGLPVYSDSELASGIIPTEGHFVFNSDQKTIVFYDGTDWLKIESQAILVIEDANLSTPTTNTNTMFATNEPSTILNLASEGYVLVPGFSNTELIGLTYPTVGMLVYNNDSKSLAYYDGASWNAFKTTATNIAIATTIDTTEKGLKAGSGSKNMSSILEVSSVDKTLKIPTINLDQIKDPKIGLLVFAKDFNAFAVFDGNNWRILF